MRDRTPDNTNEPNVNIIVNLHPTDGTHWVLVIRREGGPVYYFDSFGVETPTLFLEYVDLGSNERIQQYDESYCGSNERIQQYDESYCGAYCLYMIYLIDRGFRIKSALNILVNQCKYPGMYNECFCLGCNVNVNDYVNDLRSSFANNVNDNDNDDVNDLRSSFANNVNDNDNVKDKDNVNYNDNDLRSSFANNVNDNDDVNDNVNDNVIVQFDEKNGKASVEPVPGWTKSYQKGKPNNKECLSNNISINTNEDLQ